MNTLRQIGITGADNIDLTPETLDMLIVQTVCVEGAEIYILDGGEGAVLNCLSGPTAWYDSLEDLADGNPGLIKWQIQTRNLSKPYAREWAADRVGNIGNEFDTAKEAQAAIDELKTLGNDWAEAEYRVVLTQ